MKTYKELTERVNMSKASQSKLQAQTDQKKKGKILLNQMKDIVDSIDKIDWELINAMGIKLDSVKSLVKAGKSVQQEIAKAIK